MKLNYPLKWSFWGREKTTIIFKQSRGDLIYFLSEPCVSQHGLVISLRGDIFIWSKYRTIISKIIIRKMMYTSNGLVSDIKYLSSPMKYLCLKSNDWTIRSQKRHCRYSIKKHVSPYPRFLTIYILYIWQIGKKINYVSNIKYVLARTVCIYYKYAYLFIDLQIELSIKLFKYSFKLILYISILQRIPVSNEL